MKDWTGTEVAIVGLTAIGAEALKVWVVYWGWLHVAAALVVTTLTDHTLRQATRKLPSFDWVSALLESAAVWLVIWFLLWMGT